MKRKPLYTGDAIYTEDLWNRFVEKVSDPHKLKTYTHFDNIFDFVKNGHKVKSLVADPSLEQVSSHAFTPHLKILAKTPRYKFDESINTYELETKVRPISFSSHFDSYIYSFYAFALTEAYQEFIKNDKFDHCVLAYRSDLNGACNIQFAKRAFDVVKEMVAKHGKCTAIALDITGYFDKNQFFCLFFFTSHIYGFDRMLDAKWHIDEEEGRGWNYEDNSLFSQSIKTPNTEKFEKKLIEFLKTGNKTNSEVYVFTLRNGHLPKHATQVLGKFQNDNFLIVTNKNGSSARRGSFYINYKDHRGEPDKVMLKLR